MINRINKKGVVLFLVGLMLGVFFVKPALAVDPFNKFLKVVVMNDSTKPVAVNVQNFPANAPSAAPTPAPSPSLQKWEHWYQCHPNPSNENEIRGYLNDRGNEGFEVVAAAQAGSLICEYYKRPKQQ